jgi:outer membrane lipoprotein-sorting protein
MYRKNFGLMLGLLVVVVSVMSAAFILAEGLPAQEIIAEVDRNHKYQTAYSEARMEITIGPRKVTKSLRTWSEGNDKAFAEFTDKRDRSRILKIKDDLWLFSPTAESEVKLSGEMLKQGMAGSDFSYQDALESEHLLELYKASLTGEETLNGRSCYVLELVAKDNVEVSYYKRKMWIDKDRFIELKEELYAPSGKLLKVSATEKVEQFGDRYYPTIIVMVDKLRKNSSTRFIIDKIQFNVAIPAGTFTRQRLTGR